MPTQTASLCKTCGAALPADARFCETCGATVAVKPDSLPERHSSTRPSTPPPATPAPPPSRSSSGIWFVAGIGLALLVVCALGAFLVGGYSLWQGTQSARVVASATSPFAPTLAPLSYPTQGPSFDPPTPVLPLVSPTVPTPTVPTPAVPPASPTTPAPTAPPASPTTPAPTAPLSQPTSAIAPTAQARDYDLYVRRIDYQPAIAVAGQKVRFTVLIATDIYPASGPLFPTTRIRWRPTANSDWAEAFCPADSHYAKCDSVFEFTYAQPGTYEVTVEVDHRGEIAETNESNNSNRVIVTVGSAAVPSATPKTGPSYSAVIFSSEFDESRQLPVNPGKTFAYGVKIIFAYWTYSGATPNTAFEYNWYQDGQVVSTNGERFTQVSGKAFQWLNYGYQPKDPLDPGNYLFSVRVDGKIILQDSFVIQAPQVGGPIAGAISVYFTVQNGNPTGWIYDKQGTRHTPQNGTIGQIHVSPGDRIVLQTDQARFSLLFDCSTTPGIFNPCDFVADTTANLPKEIRPVKSGNTGYLNISRADNWAGVRSNFPSQRYPADPVLRMMFTID